MSSQHLTSGIFPQQKDSEIGGWGVVGGTGLGRPPRFSKSRPEGFYGLFSGWSRGPGPQVSFRPPRKSCTARAGSRSGAAGTERRASGRPRQVDRAGPPPSGNTQAPRLPRPESRRGAEPGHAQGSPKIWDVEDAALAGPAARGTRGPSAHAPAAPARPLALSRPPPPAPARLLRAGPLRAGPLGERGPRPACVPAPDFTSG